MSTLAKLKLRWEKLSGFDRFIIVVGLPVTIVIALAYCAVWLVIIAPFTALQFFNGDEHES